MLCRRCGMCQNCRLLLSPRGAGAVQFPPELLAMIVFVAETSVSTIIPRPLLFAIVEKLIEN